MSKFAGFVNGFSGGLSIGSRLNSMMDQGDIDEIARANPEQSTGFTADQGDELRRAAESGQYDIGWDESSKSYVVTPKSDPSMAAKVTQQGVTDFLGKRTAGTMSDTDVANARQRAIAGVVSRSDPVQGSRMMRDVIMAERDDKRFGWEEARATREMRKGAEEDANDAFMKTLEGEVGQFMQGRLAGQDGQTRPATVDDYLAASQFKAAKLIEAGKTDAAQAIIKDYNAQSFVKIQLETAQRDQALGQTIAAVNAGDLDAARQFYDRFLPDGATVTGVMQGANGSIVVERQSDGGQPMPPMTFKDVNHLTSSLAALKDPMAVYNWSQNEFRNALALRQDARAERAEGRAAASAGASKSEEAARIAAGVALFQERNPGATAAELEAVRRGVLPAVPKKEGGYKVEAGDVTTLLGTPATDANGNALVDPMTGRQVVNRNPTREREFFEFMRKNQITDTNEALQKFLAPTGGASGGGKSSGRTISKGQVVGGYEFLGGNPNDEKSWRKVSAGKVQ